MNEDKLNKQIEMYRELAKHDKDIDVGKLMLTALNESAPENAVPARQKRLAYFVSIGFPPFGLLFALRFAFSSYDDGLKTAMYCTVLTAASVITFALIFKSVLSSSGLDSQQLQQVDLQQIQELIE